MATETLRINITADNKAAITGITQVKNTVDGLTESIKVYQDKAFAEKDISKLKAYNKEIQALQAQLKQTANVGKVGFDEMGVAIQGGTNALSKSFGALRQIAYIIPGIGIAGIFNLAFEAIGHFATGLDSVEKKIKQFKDDYLSAMDGAEAGSQKEIATLQSLVKIATDESLSKKARADALKELNKEYPGYFTNTNKDLTDTDKLKKITDQLSAAIIRRGNAEALAGLIGKENAKIWEANHKNIEQGVDGLSTASKVWEGFKGVITTTNGVQAAAAIGSNLVNASLKEKADIVKVATANVKSLTDELNKNTLAQVQNGDFEKGDAKKGGTKKEKVDDYDKLQSKLAEINKLYKDRQLTNDEYNKESLSAIKSTLLGLDAESKYYQKIIDLQDQYSKNLREKGGLASIVLQPEKTKAEKKDMLGLAPTHLNDKGKQGSGVFDQDFAEQASKRQKDLEEYNQKLAITVGLTDALGNAFSGAIESGKSLGEALSQVFADLGKQIERALIKAILFKAIGAALGVATGGFSSVFMGALGLAGGNKGFAEGGTVTGPKSGYMAVLHGTEHIVRPDQMNKIVGGAAQMGANAGGGGGNMVLESRVSGTDLVLMLQRAGFSLNVRR